MSDIKVLLKEGLSLAEVGYTDSTVNLLEKYIREITLWNKRYGLVNAQGDTLIINHIFDSLAPLNMLKSKKFETLADAGSGAGLPGIPLALFLEDKKITLIERSARRVRFLENAVAVLGLGERVSVLYSPIEEVREKFDIVTFRAFRQFEEYFEYLMGLLKEGGYLFAYKGKRVTIEKEITSVERERGAPLAYTIEALEVPLLKKERHILTIHRNRQYC